MLPEVYHPEDRPWIHIENATTEQLEEQVAACPSGALSILEREPIQIHQTDDGSKGTITMTRGGDEVGLLDYVWSGEDMFIISHTEVTQRIPGMNYGTSLVNAAVAFARENDKKIMPLCPFSKARFEKDHSMHDVLYTPPAGASEV